MKDKILIVLSVSVWLLLPSLAASDCADFRHVTSVYVQDEKTIVYSSGSGPVAKIVLENCTVDSSSNIRPTKSYMCDEDRLIIDGQECAIMSLTSASSGSF